MHHQHQSQLVMIHLKSSVSGPALGVNFVGCNWAPPESDELVSVTKELTPMLGPDEFVVLIETLPFISLATSPRLEHALPDTEVQGWAPFIAL